MNQIIQDAINKQFQEGYRTHEILKIADTYKGSYHLSKIEKNNAHCIWFLGNESQEPTNLLRNLTYPKRRCCSEFFFDLIDVLAEKSVIEPITFDEFDYFYNQWTNKTHIRTHTIEVPQKVLSDFPPTPKAPDPIISVSDNVKIPEGFTPCRIDVKVLPGEFYFDGKEIRYNLEKVTSHNDFPVIVCRSFKPCPAPGQDYYFITSKLEVVYDKFKISNHHMHRWLSGNFETDQVRMEQKLEEIKKILKK